MDQPIAFIYIGGLTGKGTFIHLKGIIFQDPAVRHHQIACLQVQDITGNHLGGRDLNLLPVP